MTSAKYPISTSADEFTRLGIQADLFRDDARAMLARIGDGTGWRVLDLCCGIGGVTDVLSEWVGSSGTVIGADIDPAKLDHARCWAKNLGLGNVEFIEANAFDSGLPPFSFDLVHTRFALSVIENGLGILDHMLTLVRPDGWIFVEEVNTSTMECYPPLPEWREALALMTQTFRAVGADTTLGPRLHKLFLDKGLAEVWVKPCVHAQTSMHPMTMHLPLTLVAMRETITSQGLMGGAELDRLVDRVVDHLVKPDTLTLSFSNIQVVGRAPT